MERLRICYYDLTSPKCQKKVYGKKVGKWQWGGKSMQCYATKGGEMEQKKKTMGGRPVPKLKANSESKLRKKSKSMWNPYGGPSALSFSQEARTVQRNATQRNAEPASSPAGDVDGSKYHISQRIQQTHSHKHTVTEAGSDITSSTDKRGRSRCQLVYT